MDPSLPLQDETLGGGPLLLARSVRWVADSQDAPQGEDSGWQVDGSNQSMGMTKTFAVKCQFCGH